MKIGILGAGNIGGNLGRRFTASGHEVRFGVRDPSKLQTLLKECGPRASAADPAAAAAFGEVVVLAVPWAGAREMLASAGDLSGKVLIDTTNALRWEDGPVPALETSAAQLIAEQCPGAKVVKAWNTIGAEHILEPARAGVPANLFVCTDHGDARKIVNELGEQIGFVPLDLGPLRNARLAEHLALAWIHLAMRAEMGRDISLHVAQSPSGGARRS